MRHMGREYGLVLSGRLRVTIGFDDEHELGPGDSIAFESSRPHRLENAGVGAGRGDLVRRGALAERRAQARAGRRARAGVRPGVATLTARGPARKVAPPGVQCERTLGTAHPGWSKRRLPMSLDVQGDQSSSDRDRVAPHERRRVHREPARRAPDLHPRQARGGRHDAPGVPQQRAVDRAALQRAARPRHQGRADHRDRHRQRRLHAPVLQGAALGRRPRRRPRRDRRVAAADLRLDGAQPRLQGGLPGHLRAERRLLRAVRRTTRAAGTRSPRSACTS